VKLKKLRGEDEKPQYMECGRLFMPLDGDGVGTLFWNDRKEEFAVFTAERKDAGTHKEEDAGPAGTG
jgi:hypothetical protein